MSFTPSDILKKEVAELLTHYPEGEQRSASLMVLRNCVFGRTYLPARILPLGSLVTQAP